MTMFSFFNGRASIFGWSPRQISETLLKLDPDGRLELTPARVLIMLGYPTQDRVGDLFEYIKVVKRMYR